MIIINTKYETRKHLSYLITDYHINFDPLIYIASRYSNYFDMFDYDLKLLSNEPKNTKAWSIEYVNSIPVLNNKLFRVLFKDSNSKATNDY